MFHVEQFVQIAVVGLPQAILFRHIHVLSTICGVVGRVLILPMIEPANDA